MKRITSFSIIIAISLFFIFSDSFADKRMVLMEEFTNASCNPCASQNPTFQTYLSNNKNDIIPIIFHPNFPGSDLMYNFASAMEEGRLAYYATNGVPTVYTNGVAHMKSNANTYNGAPSDINGLNTAISTVKGTESPITITPTYTITGKTMSVNVSVNSTSALSGKILRIAVVEGYHYYEKAGSNGEKSFYYVVRQMLPDFNGQSISLTAGETKNYPYQVDIKSELYKQYLYVVAYVQDDATKEVLQAGKSSSLDITSAESLPKISVNLNVEVSQKNGFVENGVAQSRKITILNLNNKEIKAGLEINPNGFPKDWSVTLDKNEVTIPASESVDVNAIITAGATTNYSVIQINAYPIDLPDNELPVLKSTTASALSKNTKYIYYYGLSAFENYYVYAASNSTKYKNDVAFMPVLDVDAMKAYPPSNFEAIIYAFDFFGIQQSGGVLGNNYSQSVAVRQNIKDATAAGKDVLIIAENEIYTTMKTPAYVNGQAFFKNDLGVNCNQTTLRVSLNTQSEITGLLDYVVTGSANDPISNGLNITCNKHNDSQNFFTVQTDLLTLESGSKAIPFLFYDNDQTKIGGVRLENANGAKTVFMTSPLPGFPINDAVSLYTKIMDWFAAPTQNVPQITSTVSSVNFNKVNVNTPDTRDVEISNVGTQELLINSINIEDDASGVYTITDGGNLTKLTAGSKATIKVKFLPKESSTYTGTLRIKSNSATNNDLKISITGQGSTTSVDEELFAKFMKVDVAPNPVKEVSTINYTLITQNSQNVTMKLIDQTGRTVTELVNGNINNGTYSIQLNAANYSAGMYYLMSSVNGVSSQIPVVIIK